MKFIKMKIAVALCVVMIAASGNMVFASDTPSSWAQDEVTAAIEKDLVPQNLRSNYTQAITRAEFCALAARLYETFGSEITGRATFTDTNDVNVEKMAYIGVVSGIGNNRFDPNAALTREQAATMLTRLYEAIAGTPVPITGTFLFYDMDDISPWAADAILHMAAAGVMSGVGDNRFAPQQPYTREQSIVTIMRMFDFVTANIAVNVASNQPLPLPYEVGTVTVISSGAEHKPYEHFLHGGILTEGGFLSASGIFLSLEEVSALLSEILYTDDFQVIIEGEYASSIGFSMYDDNFDPVYRGKDSFVVPDEAGVYILCVDITWSNEENDLQYRGFTIMRYIFKIRVR